MWHSSPHAVCLCQPRADLAQRFLYCLSISQVLGAIQLAEMTAQISVTSPAARFAVLSLV